LRDDLVADIEHRLGRQISLRVDHPDLAELFDHELPIVSLGLYHRKRRVHASDVRDQFNISGLRRSDYTHCQAGRHRQPHQNRLPQHHFLSP
jgi:hypothetical protein